MTLVLFEDEAWANFVPLTTTRHVSLLSWGTRSLLDSVRAESSREIALWGRSELADVSRESAEAQYNERTEGEALLLNARARPDHSIRQLLEKSGRFVARSGECVVAARMEASAIDPGVIDTKRFLRLARGLDILELPRSAVFRGPWALVESNGLAITEQATRYPDQLVLPPEATVNGPPSNLIVHESCQVEGHLSFDARRGPIIVAEGTILESFSRVSGPCFIGPNTKIHSALLREGSSIFEDCRIGGEVENSIVMAHSNKSHHGYVGDSVVGEWVNLGAGSTFSNLKNTYGTVKADAGGKRVDTGMLKFGPVIGDMAKVSIGCMIFGGKTVGVASHVGGLIDTSVPSFTYCDGRRRKIELRIDSVIETQRRMMERRGKSLTKNQESLIRKLFAETRLERRRARVKKGRLG